MRQHFRDSVALLSKATSGERDETCNYACGPEVSHKTSAQNSKQSAECCVPPASPTFSHPLQPLLRVDLQQLPQELSPTGLSDFEPVWFLTF